MEESSSEELSKELSNLSFTSNDSSALSTATESRKSSHNADSTNAAETDEYSDKNNISRGNSEVSLLPIQSNKESGSLDVSREGSSVASNNDSQYNDDDDEKKENYGKISSQEVSSLAARKESSPASENDQISRENSSLFLEEGLSRESSVVTDKQSLSRESTSQFSRETTKMSEQDDSSDESNVISRENTMTTNSEMYENDFETSRESTMLTPNENHTDDSSESREQSFYDQQNGEDEMEKENSVLIERDGKFELVDKRDLEAEELEMLGLSAETDDKANEKRIGRPKSSTNKNPEYAHVTSAYALTETQREMKKRRISVRQMRMSEEKQRQMEEEESQRIANEKSYKKWLMQKSATSQRQMKKEIADAAANEERKKLAEKSYNLWLKEKEQKQKEERKIEKIRLADEAEHYIVRDRVMCERSFRQWLKQKKQEENNKMSSIEKPRKKTARVKQKPVTQEQKVQSAIHRPKLKADKEEQRLQSQTRLNKKTEKVRYADLFGYQHPPSIDDVITYTR